jgi:polynucleotide 5'-kinase involved in rRNA processing
MLEYDPPIQSSDEWDQALALIADSPGLVMVLGSGDVGKTTWIRWASRRLIQRGITPLGIVDADLGQATIGPPTTVALKIYRELSQREYNLDSVSCDALYFVGSVSPGGHLLQTLVGCKLLVEKAKRYGIKAILMDTSGLVTQGLGFQLKLRKIEIVGPDHLVVIQRGTELDSLLKAVKQRAGLMIHRLPVLPHAKIRTVSERAAHRALRFAACFASATRMEVSTDKLVILSPTGKCSLFLFGAADVVKPEALQDQKMFGLLVGLNNASNETLGLGLLDGVSEDGSHMYLTTSFQDASAIRIVQMGNLFLSRTYEEFKQDFSGRY